MTPARDNVEYSLIEIVSPDYVSIASSTIDMLENSHNLEEELMGYIENYMSNASKSRLKINLSNVEETDSSGIAILVKALAKLKKMGIELHLEGLKEKVANGFYVCRLNNLFPISPDN